MKFTFIATTVGVVAIAAALAGCIKHDGQESAATGQVVARVGAQVVTAAELNNEMRLANIPADKQQDPTEVRGILSELVLRKYLVQQAELEKLDREPGVLLNVLRSREQDLANAYMSQRMAARSVHDSEVQEYVKHNPARFSQRRMMTIEEITFTGTHYNQSVVEGLKSAKSLDEVDQTLAENVIPHSRSVSMTSESDVPAGFLKALKDNKGPGVVYGRAGARTMFFQTRSDPYPLEGQAASNQAQQILSTEQLKAEIGAQTSAANREVKYEGKYAGIMAAAPVSGPQNAPVSPGSAPPAAPSDKSRAP